MKKILSLLFLVLCFVIYLVYEKPKTDEYRVLEVIEGDKFYLDLNKNNKADEGELIHIKGINCFPLKYSEKLQKNVDDYNLTPYQAVALGYFAKQFAKKTLENNYVEIENLSDFNKLYKYRFATVLLKNRDYAKTLLNEGLAYVYKENTNQDYLNLQNQKKIKDNVKNAQKLQLVTLNKDNNKYHQLSCKYAAKMKNFEILPLALIKDGKPCGYCLKGISQLKPKEDLKDEILNIEKDVANISSANIKLYFIDGTKYKKPSCYCRTSSCQMILHEIRNAKNTIDIALYGFGEQDEIFDSLVNARKRGVKIRAVVDKGNKEVYKNTDKFQKIFGAKDDGNSNKLMHNKFFIFDDKKVVTGTTNISSSGTGGYNTNVVVLINNVKIANAYKKEFEQLYERGEGDFKKNKSRSDFSNLGVYFLPDSTLFEQKIKPLTDNSSKNIYVGAFFLTYKPLADSLIEAEKRGVEIKVIADATGAKNKYSQIHNLRRTNIPVKVENWGGKNHQKVIMIDDTFLILGSMNFTKSGFNSNDENLLIIKNPELALAWKKFFLKLYVSIPDIYLKKIPSAEGFESKYSCFDGIDNDYDGKIDSADEGCKRK